MTAVHSSEGCQRIDSLASPAAGVVFALALLSSGQTSSITATLAGQVVSEGFVEWRISVSIPHHCFRWRPCPELNAVLYPAVPSTDHHKADRPRALHGCGYRCRPTWYQHVVGCITGRSINSSAIRRVSLDLVDLLIIDHESQGPARLGEV